MDNATPINKTRIAQVDAPWVWLGRDQSHRDDGIVELTPAEVTELLAAAKSAAGYPLDELTPENFPLPKLSKTLAGVCEEVSWGRGFVLLRGLPMHELPADQIKTVFCGIGAHLGVSVSQSADGDRLGDVIDRGGTDRYYTRGGELEFHMDPVDVVGLLCLKAAVDGGASRIVSSMAIHNIILEERPEVLQTLYTGFHNSRRGFGETTLDEMIPMYIDGDRRVECYHLPITIRQADEEGFKITPAEQEAMDLVAEVAARPEVYLDMHFQEGDIQFLNNRTILHARTDYVDHPDPALKRHLLRLWLMMADWPDRAGAQNFRAASGDRVGGGIKPANTK